MELKDEFVQEILSFQALRDLKLLKLMAFEEVQALHTADMELVLRAAALGQELKQQGQGQRSMGDVSCSLRNHL